MKKPISITSFGLRHVARHLVPLAAALLATTAGAVLPPGNETALADYDRRAASVSSATMQQRALGLNHLAQRLPGAKADFDRLVGSPRFVRHHAGFLTGPNGEGLGVSALTVQAIPANDPFRGVRAFLNEHAQLFGHGDAVLNDARLSRDSVGQHNGLRTLVWQQQVDGIPVFESVLIANLTRRGELVTISSQMLPQPVVAADLGTPNRIALQLQPAISAQRALVLAAQELGDTLDEASVLPDGAPEGEGYQPFRIGTTRAHARQVWLPMEREALRLAWEVFLMRQRSVESYQVLVDAETGEALVRRSRTCHISDATYNVYTSDSPSPFSPGWPTPNATQPPLTNRVMVTLSALDVVASPNGWINDGDNETMGNNADTFLDRDFDFQPDGPRPQGNPPRVFDFPLDLTLDPIEYTNASIVQMFYWVNYYHDRLYQLGFTESAGNFQENNFGRGGLGGDSIIGYVQSGADVGFNNNAFFIPSPDGVNGQIAMFTWDFPNPDRDGDLDAEVIFHEATHGTSTRLVGGGLGLNAWQSRGLGEGWSDFYATALLSEATDDPNASYPMGGYATYQWYGLLENYYFGIRTFPYSTDMSRSPLTFKDMDPTQIDPHAGVPRNPISGPFSPADANNFYLLGEIWANTLWQMRANLIAKYGFAVGNELTLQLTTDGMKLTPANPNVLAARDAIILADLVNNAGANAKEIWSAFAKRGMGFSARCPDSTSNIGVVEAFDMPGLNVQGVLVSGGNGNGVVDVNECNNLEIIIGNFNDFTVTKITATLNTTTPGVGFGVRQSPYPDLPPLGVGTNLVPFTLSTAPYFACGTPITLEVLIKSDQETVTNTVVLNTGSVGDPVRFDSTAPVAIPDNLPAGTNSPIVVSNITTALREVAVSLFLTHTWDADLRLELVGPDGTTVVLSDGNGGSGDNYGAACSPERLRTTFDDDGLIPIANGRPPFLGTYRPDQPLAAFVGKFGTNVNGTWNLHVVDQFGLDVGIVQCWSLFLWPAACEDGGGSCPGADVGVTLSDAPDPVFVGSNLVYTITATNRGPSGARSTVITHVLPPGTIYVSATTTQGTVVSAGNSVICNLGTLPFASGATVRVTVLPITPGTLLSSANITSLDPDGDLSNNNASVLTRAVPQASDLAVVLADEPDPVFLGSLLTYTVAVTNNGPSAASGVTVTNTLPMSVVIQGVSTSQGVANVSGNVVVLNLGGIPAGGHAMAALRVIPGAEGNLVALARVSANQADPVTANNSSTASTVVGPAADLVVSLVDAPDPVVIQSNLTYRVGVTNYGPSPATGVVLNNSLPPSVNIVSNFITRGAVTVSGKTVVGEVGRLEPGESALLIMTVRPTAAGSLLTTSVAASGQADPNPANNTATATTIVAPPFVAIQAAGSTLTGESFSPANGAVERDETITVSLRLGNTGNVSNTNLVATLLATGGVEAPSGPQTYGVLPPGGLPVSRSFTFTARGTNNGVVTATLQLTDGNASLPDVTFTFALERLVQFRNATAIVIPDSGSASPYPSTITVSGVTGTVGRVAVTLSNLNHTFPADADVLLVSPRGETVVLMAAAGDRFPVADTTVTFDDTAASPVPSADVIQGTTYRPASYNPSVVFASPAPAGPYGAALSQFAGISPNGTWQLYVTDHQVGDSGSIASGWSLVFSLISPVNRIADLAVRGAAAPPSLDAGELLTLNYTITNAGPDTANAVAFTNLLPAGVTFGSATASQGSVQADGGLISGTLGSLTPGAVATVTIIATANDPGGLSTVASVTGSEVDLNTANNSVTVLANAALPLVDLAIQFGADATALVVGSNVTFSAQVTNAGPGAALDTAVAEALPVGFEVVNTDISAGSVAVTNGAVTFKFGKLGAGASGTATLVARALQAGTFTNTVLAATRSQDASAGDNTAAVILTVTPPQARVVIAGTKLVAESQMPANGVIDPGETVTLALALRNAGELPTGNLVATLLAGGGVTAPGGAQTYGALATAGAAVWRSFDFTASAPAGGTIQAVWQLADGAATLPNVSASFAVSQVTTFTNTAAISVLDRGVATPYPSTITVSGLTGVVSKAVVRLNGLSHGFPDDLDVLLAGPQGQRLLLMSDAGGGWSVTNLVLTFDDAAGANLPDATRLSSGSFKPTDYETADSLPTPAPSRPYSGLLATFAGTDPNGVWSLYVLDDATGDLGAIAGGWSLTLSTAQPVSALANLALTAQGTPASLLAGDSVTYTLTVANQGPAAAGDVTVLNTLPAGARLISATPSQGSVTTQSELVTAELGTIAAGASAQLTLVARLNEPGVAVNQAVVSSGDTDLDGSDNSASVATEVGAVIPARLAGELDAAGGVFRVTLIGQPGVTYVLQASADFQAWTFIGTNTVPAGGQIKFTDPLVPAPGQRYYRAQRLVP